ncbi:MAG: cell wall hydrolase [Pseudomonadota bacterium]
MNVAAKLALSLLISFVGAIESHADANLSTSSSATVDLDTAATGTAWDFGPLLSLEQLGVSAVGMSKVMQLTRAPAITEDTLAGLTKRDLRDLPKASGGPEWRCLTEALYFEARGESLTGQFAVAEVVLNRVASPAFPDTVCGVINQGTGNGKHACQFSYNCDGKAEVFSETRAYDTVGKVARILLDGAHRGLTDGATHYHTKAVSPRWSRVYNRTATYGVHHFYKRPIRLSEG